jgi:hypothetical protein
MKNLLTRKIYLLVLVLFLAAGSAQGQLFHRNPEKKLFGKTQMKGSAPKVKESHSVKRAKKQQEANDRKLKKEYAKSVKKSKQRSYDIQTPEVQDRMKQNAKDGKTRDKMKKKKMKDSNRKAGKKYD